MKSLKDFFSYHSENYALGFFALALIFGGWTYEFPQLNQLVEILLVLAFLVRGPKPIETERVRRPYTPFFRALMIAVSCLAIISFATVVVANQSRFFSSLAAQDDGGQTRKRLTLPNGLDPVVKRAYLQGSKSKGFDLVFAFNQFPATAVGRVSELNC